MIDVGYQNCQFACDECPIVEGLEHRLTNAEKYGYPFQFDYCGCEKVGDIFFMCGYCEDAWCREKPLQKNGRRKTGRAYRRQMKRQKFLQKIKIAENSIFSLGLGYDKTGIEHDKGWRWLDPDRVYNYTYIKPRSHSRTTTFWKRHSNRIIRRKKMSLPAGKGNQHQKVFDYWWEIF